MNQCDKKIGMGMSWDKMFLYIVTCKNVLEILNNCIQQPGAKVKRNSHRQTNRHTHSNSTTEVENKTDEYV